MEDKHANRTPPSSPHSPSFLPPSSTVDVSALQLEHTSDRNVAESDNALLNQSLAELLPLPKAETLAQPGLIPESDASNIRSPLSLHILAQTQTPRNNTTSSSRGEASTDSDLSAVVDKGPAPSSSSKPLFSNTDIKVRDFITHPVSTALDISEETVRPLSHAPDFFIGSRKEARLSTVASPELQVADNISELKRDGPLASSSSRRSSLDSIRSIRPALFPQGLNSAQRRVSASSIISGSSDKHPALPRYLGSYHSSDGYSRLTRAVSSPAIFSNRGIPPPRKSFSLPRIVEGRLRASSPLLIDIYGPIDADILFPGDHSPVLVSASSHPPHLRKVPLFVPRRIHRRHSLMSWSMEANASGIWLTPAEFAGVEERRVLREQRDGRISGLIWDVVPHPFSPSPMPSPPPLPPLPPPPSRLCRCWRAVKKFFRH